MTYDERSAYLKRELVVVLFDKYYNNVAFRGSKITVGGSKFIGIQQDNFVIKLHNINYALLADALSRGYRYIRVQIEEKNKKAIIVFNGEIRMVNVGKSSAVEREVEFICLTRASDILANLVVPITMHSSMNGWTIKEALKVLEDSISTHCGQTISLCNNLDKDLDKILIKESYNAHKSPVEIIEDLVTLVNERKPIGPNAPAWFDYKLTASENNSDGLFSIFSSNESIRALNIGPETGLLDAPTISDLEISFNHIYHDSLVPGRLVRLDNKWVSTMGNDSAFVWAWDPAHQYLITEARYSLENYPNRFTVSCRARSYSKYNRFTATNQIYGEN